MLELMHYAAELRDLDEFRQPKESKPSKKEMDMAKALISSMSDKWEPEAYQDEYRDALVDMIEDKIAHGDKAAPKAKAKKRPSNVIDLVAVLEESLRGSSSGKKKAARKASSRRGNTTRKKSAKKAAARKRGGKKKAA